MAEIPEELIVETLQRLPVKSVLRFRCLSKPLCAVIANPNFINSHFRKSSQNPNLRKLIIEDKRGRKVHVYNVNIDLEEANLPLEIPFSSLLQSVCGYCNGLVLLFRYVPFEVFLWNPSTRQSRDLPVCPFQIQEVAKMMSGLGYDDSIDDYKAVFIVLHKSFSGFELQVWIYTSKSDIWRRAQNFPYDYFSVAFPKIGHFTDGSLYWLVTLNSNNGSQEEIVAFDMIKETFSLVPQPASPIDTFAKLHVLEECLCISYFFQSSTSHHADLYTRKKDGADQFTWKILYSVTVEDPILYPLYGHKFLNLLVYSKRRGKILLGLNRGCMFSYDVEEKSFVKSETETDPDSGWPMLCLESLVSVGVGA